MEKKVEQVSEESKLAVVSKSRKLRVHDRGSLSDAMCLKAEGQILQEMERLEVWQLLSTMKPFPSRLPKLFLRLSPPSSARQPVQFPSPSSSLPTQLPSSSLVPSVPISLVPLPASASLLVQQQRAFLEDGVLRDLLPYVLVMLRRVRRLLVKRREVEVERRLRKAWEGI